MYTGKTIIFQSASFRFSIEVPDSWKFMPAAWSPIAQMKNAEQFNDHWIKNAKLPFCCASRHHSSDSHVYPTLQVTARPSLIPDNETALKILQMTQDFLISNHENPEIVRATSEAIVAGYRANILYSTFDLHTRPQNDILVLKVISRSYSLFTEGVAYTVGLSGSADPLYCDESELDFIISSVRIGATTHM
jgi:hypothetical protein